MKHWWKMKTNLLVLVFSSVFIAGSVADTCPTIKPKPFYATISDIKITSGDLGSNFEEAVNRFRYTLLAVLPGEPTVTALSVTASGNDNSSPAIGLFGIVYTSDSTVDANQIKTALEQDPDLSVQKIFDAGQKLTDPNDQFCPKSNPIPIVTTKSPSATTRPSPPGYTPCNKRIAFAIDSSANNGYYKVLRKFLINQIFAGNWNHLERLGVEWYSNRLEAKFPFDYFAENSDKDLDYVRRAINSRPQVPKTNPNLQVAFQGLIDNYKPSNDYPDVRYVVFVSQKLSQVIVDGLKPLAKQLNSNGGLALIALGSSVDQGRTYLQQLTDKFVIWSAPNNDQVLPNWEDFFWYSAYGCSGSPPSDAPTIGTEPTITFPPIPTTTIPPPIPCDGRIVVLLDSGKSLTQTLFDQQNKFVSTKLFAPEKFNKYGRLTVGYFDQMALINDFGHITGQNDIAKFVSSITYDSAKDSKLRVALNGIAQKGYASTPGPQITAVVFVSRLTQAMVEDAREAAQSVQQQGIRLILVAHGFSVTTDLLAQVTGDSKTVYEWKTSQTEIPNSDKWLSNVLNCQAN